MRVTHPFHPLCGRSFVFVGERYGRYLTHVLLRGEDGRIWAVPRLWTDVAAPDPEAFLSGGRALFTAADLIDLAALVERLLELEGRSGGVR